MGTDCKSAAFSFGGSNPPAPTKKALAYLLRWSFLFCLCVRLTNAGGFEQQRSRPPPAAETGRRGWGSAPGSFLFCAAREIHEKCANKNHRPGGWWFGDQEKTGFALIRAGRRRGQRASACWILAKSSSVRASGRMRASNPAASMAAVTASLGIPRPLAMALAAVLRR